MEFINDKRKFFYHISNIGTFKFFIWPYIIYMVIFLDYVV